MDTVLLGASNTSIQIEGLLDRAVIRMQKVSITVFCRDLNNGGWVPQSAEAPCGPSLFTCRGISSPISCSMVLADKLKVVDLLFGPVRFAKGSLKSVGFETAPVPSQADDEAEC